MKIRAYLVISSGGTVEIRKQRPQPAFGRVAILINIDISSAWFEQSVPVVNLTIPDAHVLPMPTITTEPLEETTEEDGES
jgi:hypothetical protein